MRYKVIKFFDKKVLESIHAELASAIWKDGSVSFSDPSIANLYKKNFQTNISNEIIFQQLDANQEFLEFTIPEQTNGLFISKTMSGGFYRPHFDLMRGNFSVSIFLNDPSEYEGGELCLLIDNKEEKFKLKPGYGVVYETGITHRVNKVTSGQRLACVFWTTSFIHDINDLKKYRYYRMMRERYEEKLYDKCYDFHYDLNSLFTRKCDEIVRKWMWIDKTNRSVS
jgi:PKHD-type hydroxylase